MEVIGLNETLAGMRVFGKVMEEKIKMALEMAATPVINAAKENHPHNIQAAHAKGRFASQTGLLVNSIRRGKTRVSKNNISIEINAGGIYKGREIKYAEFVEYGTCRSRPYPYLRPAIEQNKSQIVSIFRRVLK